MDNLGIPLWLAALAFPAIGVLIVVLMLVVWIVPYEKMTSRWNGW